MPSPTEEFSFEDAEEAFDEGDFELAIDICHALIEQDPADVDALALLGDSLMQLDEFEAAEEVYRDAVEMAPESPVLMAGHGVTLFELGRFEEARAELDRAVAMDGEVGGAPFYLGLLAERAGRHDVADGHFRRANSIDPEQFPLPVDWSDADVREAVGPAMEQIPEPARPFAADAGLAIEDLPSQDLLASFSPPLSPLILCLFEGGDAPDVARPRVVRVFRRNLGKVARDKDELAQEIARAFMYEIVRFYEMDDETARRLGIEDALFGPPGSGPDIRSAIDAALARMDDEDEGEPPQRALPPGGSDATRGPRGGPGRRGNGRGN